MDGAAGRHDGWCPAGRRAAVLASGSANCEETGAMDRTQTWLKAALVSRELVAERTMSFSFAKPPGWSYRAGQSVDMTLLDPPNTDAEGNLRAFTLSSAPREDVL